MRRRHLLRSALSGLLLTTVLSGCYAVHERAHESTPASSDPAYVTAATTRATPPTPGCAGSQWAPLAPPGLDGLRLPTITAIDGGFVASVVHMNAAFDYPTAVARMRSDLTGMLDAPRDAGIVTSEGGVVSRPAMVTGGDGRLASCAVAYTTASLEHVPGGVAFFDRRGGLERIVRFEHGCADVAWIDDRWVALEVRSGALLDAPRELVVFDGSLEIADRIALSYRGNLASFADRVVGLHGRAIVMAQTQDGVTLASIDLDTSVVESTPFPFEPPIDLAASQFVLVEHDERVGVAWVDADGSAWWVDFDDALAPTSDPILLGSAPAYTSYVDATAIDGGVVVAWVESGLALALVRDDGEVTRARAELPETVTGLIETIEIAAQDDVVAIALYVIDSSAARSTVGVWSSRCSVR